ncbi:MAG: ATP-binding protein [Cyanobacteria bacterium P01_H01_bin.35]
MPKKQPVKWYTSLNAQTMIILGIFASSLISSFMFTINREGKKLVFRESSRLIQQTGDSAVSDLTVRTQEVAALTRTLGLTVQQLSKSETIFRNIIPAIIDFQGDMDIAGGGVWPEPYSFDPDVEKRSFFWGRELDGTLKYYDDYNESGYHDQDWYVIAPYLEPGKCFWSRSYVDPFSQEPMVTCTVATQENGKFSGVVTIDLRLEGLQSFTTALQKKTQGYIFIVDRDNKFISFPDTNLVRRIKKDSNGKITEFIFASELVKVHPEFAPIAEALEKINQEILEQAQQMPNYKLETVAQLEQRSYQINSKQAQLMSVILADPLAGKTDSTRLLKQLEIDDDWLLEEKSIVDIFHIPNTYWKLVIVKPFSENIAVATAISQFLINRTIFIVLIGALLVLLAVKFRLLKPIQNLSKAAKNIEDKPNQIVDSQWQQELPTKRQDEIGELGRGFISMAEQLKESWETLEQRVEERTAELARSNQKLEIANRAKTKFLANMSHELRTPLNGILGYAQNLQRSHILDENASKSVETIYKCGTHLLTLINDVLDMSKIEANKMELLPTDFYFPAFMQGIVEMCRFKAKQKKIALVYQCDAELPEGVRADEKRLRQVLINLLSNAIKFTNNGKVTFTVSRSETGFRFEVRDTGMGITPEHLKTIFLPFEQVGDTKNQSEGTGLGLAISQEIVQMMNSQIYVESQVGIGSVFWFDLSLESSREWVKSAQYSNQGLIKGIKGKPGKIKILAVDDKWENRSVIVNLLQPLGFELEEARNGQEGWEKARVFLPDLVITDLIMPVMDGFEMIRWFRESEILSNVPILVSSASVFESDQYRSFEVGGNDFLPKPVQARELLNKLQQHLGLEWVYERETVSEENEVDEIEIIPPGAEVLDTLYELAMKGNFKGIVKQVQILEKVNDKYVPFVQQIKKLSREFQDQEIIELIERFRG